MDRALQHRRFSKVTQVNASTMRPVNHVEINDAKRGSTASRRLSTPFANLALFQEESDTGKAMPTSFISAYVTPGPNERASSEKKKANLGVMLGVYLPTIQHILGVTMFIRLAWVVGIAGIPNTMLLLMCCCLCTLLTSISLSAVATNGVVESGGAYFIISRNLGAEFGSAVGILFYLANTIAASMYLVGGVEVLLLYIWPAMTIGGEPHEVHDDTGAFGMMTNNYRIYGSLFLLVQVLIVAMGVRFVQLMAPISLLCVILSILACFAGGIEKTILHNGQSVCMLNDQLLPTRIFLPEGEPLSNLCHFCRKSEGLSDEFCSNSSASKNPFYCTHFAARDLHCAPAYTGFKGSTLNENVQARFMEAGESSPGVKADGELEVYQTEQTTFYLLLAIYFPAVTGIMTGANMSGDLKDPQRSIPRGTIAATVTTSLIYFALALLFGSTIIGPVLRDKTGKSIGNTLVVSLLAWPTPWVVIVGTFTSTFGAALQCLCSAPRLLQSIAKDDVIPFLRPFATVTSKNEPFLGLLITAFIAECALLLGAVDSIAEVLDFFFLMCYAFINFICALHSLLGSPNWRPRFKYYHWSLSLLGAVLCFFIMFSTNWRHAIFACLLTMVIYKYVEWKGAKKEWGDGIRGLALSTAQYSLMKVEDKDPHPKNWRSADCSKFRISCRPQILLLIDGIWSKDIIDMRCINMLNLAGQLKAGQGLAVAVAFVRGLPERLEDRRRSDDIKKRLMDDMTNARLRGFAKTLIYSSEQLQGCVSSLYQSVGIGGLRPNTVMITWPRREAGVSPEHDALFAEQLISGVVNEQCILIAKGITDFPMASERLVGFIDLWWVVHDGGILMLVAFLLKQHKVWRGCQLRIFAVSERNDDEHNETMKQELQKYIYMLRIDAAVFIVDIVNSELSKSAVQRTIQMEETWKKLSLVNGSISRQNSRVQVHSNPAFVEPADESLFEVVIDLDPPRAARISRNTGTAVTETSFINPTPGIVSFDDSDSSNVSMCDPSKLFEGIDKSKVQKMNTSIRMNHVIVEHSSDSQLVLLNLPRPPGNREDVSGNYMIYLEVLTENLPRVLLIRGSGREVLTVNS